MAVQIYGALLLLRWAVERGQAQAVVGAADDAKPHLWQLFQRLFCDCEGGRIGDQQPRAGITQLVANFMRCIGRIQSCYRAARPGDRMKNNAIFG